jgi:hypothetical protein
MCNKYRFQCRYWVYILFKLFRCTRTHTSTHTYIQQTIKQIVLLQEAICVINIAYIRVVSTESELPVLFQDAPGVAGYMQKISVKYLAPTQAIFKCIFCTIYIPIHVNVTPLSDHCINVYFTKFGRRGAN